MSQILTDHTVVAESYTTPSFSPLYQQIKQAILQSLQAGEWRPQEALPSEIELARRYGVSQGTVRKAMDELAAENFVVRRQGKGTFVSSHNESHVEYRFLRLYPDQGTQDSEGRAQRKILSFQRRAASPSQAKQLELKKGQDIIQIRRLLTFGGTPTILEDIWLPAASYALLTAEMLEQHQGPTYALFERSFGISTVRAQEELRAVAATAKDAEILGVSPNTPLLQVKRTSFTYNDSPIELRCGLYRTDTHHYRSVLS